MKIIDISQEVLSCNVYEGDPTPCGEKLMDMKNGEIYNLSSISMCAHNGTHIDAPLHFFSDGSAIGDMSLDHFFGDCLVVEKDGEVSDSDAYEILDRARECGNIRRILIKGTAVVTEASARVFAEADILLIGVESQSVGPLEAPMAVHKILLGKGIALLEGIVLRDVMEGRYLLSCAPLNISGFEGSPCRAILIEE